MVLFFLFCLALFIPYFSHLSPDIPHLLSNSLGWFLLSRFLSIRSDSNCFKTVVAYSISPCRAVMIRDATLPRSRIENDLEIMIIMIIIKLTLTFEENPLKSCF